MLSVKIEFCPLDWYSSSLATIVLYKRMYICKMLPSNRQKLKKKKMRFTWNKFCIAWGILTSPKDVIRFVMQSQFSVKFMSLNKGVKLKFHALLAKTSKNSQIFKKTSILPVNPCSGTPKNSTILFSILNQEKSRNSRILSRKMK